MTSEQDESGKLQRTMGVPGALAIGVGTMVGAGIFVFPGIAGGQAGPAAILSFVLGGAVATLVALAAAELATAMPHSGGGYLYVSRALGPFAGMLVGVALCVGLSFASAFYLVAFAQYIEDLLHELGVALPPEAVRFVAPTTALGLCVLGVMGTEGVARLQRALVVALTIALAALFGYGLLRVLGLGGSAPLHRPFAPRGVQPVFTTAALVFTSYLGFVQIVTVAGDVKRPSRTLPRALIGSVLLAMGLYALVVFVATRELPAARLAELGEAATITVAEHLVGPVGGFVVLGAGVLATLSSANASILSASRAVLALARNGQAPAALQRVHPRYGTPHRAQVTVGLLIGLLGVLDHLELLAQVASVLHLLLYGLICVSLLLLRRRGSDDYAPTFRVPAAAVVAPLGAAACFGLLVFMAPMALRLGAGVLFGAAALYFIHRHVGGNSHD